MVEVKKPFRNKKSVLQTSDNSCPFKIVTNQTHVFEKNNHLGMAPKVFQTVLTRRALFPFHCIFVIFQRNSPLQISPNISGYVCNIGGLGNPSICPVISWYVRTSGPSIGSLSILPKPTWSCYPQAAGTRGTCGSRDHAHGEFLDNVTSSNLSGNAKLAATWMSQKVTVGSTIRINGLQYNL